MTEETSRVVGAIKAREFMALVDHLADFPSAGLLGSFTKVVVVVVFVFL